MLSNFITGCIYSFQLLVIIMFGIHKSIVDVVTIKDEYPYKRVVPFNINHNIVEV